MRFRDPAEVASQFRHRNLCEGFAIPHNLADSRPCGNSVVLVLEPVPSDERNGKFHQYCPARIKILNHECYIPHLRGFHYLGCSELSN